MAFFVLSIKTWCEIYGYTHDEVVDKVSPLDLVHPEDKKIMEENVRKRLSGETDYVEYETRSIRQDGKTIVLKIVRISHALQRASIHFRDRYRHY